MAAITRSAHPSALWPGVKAFFGQEYKELPKYWSQCFEVMTSDKAYEEFPEIVGMPLAGEIKEGAGVTYGRTGEGYKARLTNVVYGLGYILTREQREDNQYRELSEMFASQLARSMNSTKEIVHANIFNRAFSGSYLGGDGVALCSASHPSRAGNQLNKMATDAAFSEAAMEDLYILIANATDATGKRIGLMGRKVVVPTALMFAAERLGKSDLRINTPNNDINAIKSMGFMREVIVNPYLDSSTAYFVLTDLKKSLISLQRRALEFTKDADFDTENAKAKATERYAVGWADWRGVYGSDGVG